MIELSWKQRFLDAFVVYFVLGPVMVVAWISTWLLVSTEVVYPQNKTISVWISVAIGLVGSIVAAFEQDTIHRLATSRGQVFYTVVSRLYSYVMFFISVNAWRSVWDGWDLYTGVSEYNALISGTAAFLGLMVLRCSRQVVFTPCAVVMDFPESTHFQVTTYFKTETKRGWRHLLDVLFSVFVVGFLGFTVWRGWWQYMDYLIYPHDRVASAVCSLGISYGTLITLTILQPVLVWLCAKGNDLHWLLGLLVEDIVIFLSGISCINYWKGFWILFNMYIPYPHLKLWLGHASACILLLFSLAFNSALARGCSFDGEHTDGSGVIQTVQYTSSLLKVWKSSTRQDTGKKEEQSLCALFCTLCAPNLSKRSLTSDRDSDVCLLRMSTSSSCNERIELSGQLDANTTSSPDVIVLGNGKQHRDESQMHFIGGGNGPTAL